MYIPEGILCTNNHEYIYEESENIYTLGITDIGLNNFGDIISVDLPENGITVEKGDIFATVESIKCATELIMPIKGQIIEVNETLSRSPEIISEDPYGKGWFIKVKSDENLLNCNNLFDYEDYKDEF